MRIVDGDRLAAERDDRYDWLAGGSGGEKFDRGRSSVTSRERMLGAGDYEQSCRSQPKRNGARSIHRRAFRHDALSQLLPSDYLTSPKLDRPVRRTGHNRRSDLSREIACDVS